MTFTGLFILVFGFVIIALVVAAEGHRRVEDLRRVPVVSVLAHRPFRAIWYVGSLSEFARRMELLILSWLILEVTDSYFLLGMVLVFNNLPRPVIALYSGIIADRISRHRVIFLVQTTNTLTAAAMLCVIAYDIDLLQPWHVFIAIAMQGTTKAVEDPSRRTAIIDIVGDDRLVNALSLDVMSNTAGKMIGPIWAGVLLATVDFSGAYVFVVGVHLLTMWMVTRLEIPMRQGASAREPVWRSLGVAIGFARHSPNLVGLLYVTIVMNAVGFPAQQFIPAIGRDFLGVGPALVGLLAAGDSFGQLAGAGMMTLTRNVRHHGRLFVTGSAAILVTFLLFVWAPWYTLAFLLLALGGLGQSGFSTMQTAIALLAAPHEMRGRMLGLLSFCIGIGTPLGGFEMSLMAAAFTAQGAISANALIGLLLLLPTVAYPKMLWQPLSQPSPRPAEV